jgi:regulator of sigma E protease
LLTTSIISIVILLGVLIFAHEIGHFLAAKYCGVKVLKFSLGFGPRLVGRKWGETEYLISWFPLGGYVKLLGESETESLSDEEKTQSFSEQSVWRRIIIVLAGPLFNFLLAVLIFTFVYMYGIPVLTPRIGETQTGSPAASAGVIAGDIVKEINGKRIQKWDDLSDAVEKSNGTKLRFVFKRGESNYTVSIQPRIQKLKNVFGEDVKAFKIGVLPADEFYTQRLNLFFAFWQGTKQTYFITKMTLLSIYKMIEGVVSPTTMGGPILIAKIAGKQAQKGFIPFLLFMALLSINLGVLNLLPIPVLDGGHLLFFMIEAIKGRPVKPQWRELAQSIGFVIIVILMILVFYLDLTRVQ